MHHQKPELAFIESLGSGALIENLRVVFLQVSQPVTPASLAVLLNGWFNCKFSDGLNPNQLTSKKSVSQTQKYTQRIHFPIVE